MEFMICYFLHRVGITCVLINVFVSVWHCKLLVTWPIISVFEYTSLTMNLTWFSKSRSTLFNYRSFIHVDSQPNKSGKRWYHCSSKRSFHKTTQHTYKLQSSEYEDWCIGKWVTVHQYSLLSSFFWF